MNPGPAVSGPRSVGDVLDGAFRIFRAHFAPLVFTAAALLIPMGVLSGVLTGRYVRGMQDLVFALEMLDSGQTSGVLTSVLPNVFLVMGTYMLLAVLALVLAGLVHLALTAHVLAILNRQPLTFLQSLQRAFGRFWAFVGMRVISVGAIGVITLAIVILAGISIAILGVGAGLVSSIVGEGPGSGLTMAAAVLFALCAYLGILLLVIVPAVYLSARWIAAVPGLVDQRWGPVQALRSSWHLTRRYLWRSVFFLVLLGLLSILITTLPVLLFQQLLLALLPFNAMVVAAIASALGSLANVLWQPISAAALVLYYVDLRVRQEGYDLTLRIQQLEADVRPTQVQP